MVVRRPRPNVDAMAYLTCTYRYEASSLPTPEPTQPLALMVDGSSALQDWLDLLMQREARLPEAEQHRPRSSTPLTEQEVLTILNTVIPDPGGIPWTADRLPPPPDERFQRPDREAGIGGTGAGSHGDEEHELLHALGRIPANHN